VNTETPTDEAAREGLLRARGENSAWWIPILIIDGVSAIRGVTAGPLAGSVRIDATACRRTRVGRAFRCAASTSAAGCARRSASATGTARRSTTGSAGATASRSAATALC
jgi:hypothetical protein